MRIEDRESRIVIINFMAFQLTVLLSWLKESSDPIHRLDAEAMYFHFTYNGA